MLIMKKYIFKTILLLTIVPLLFLKCTDHFDELNTNPTGITEEQLEGDYNMIGAYFPQMQQMIYMNYNWGDGKDWTYQIAQNLNADIYSGYMMSPTPFNANVNNLTYSLVDGWNFAAWEYTYAHFMTAALEVEKKAVDEYAHFGAVAKVLKVTAMHRISNLYGPIIYSEYGKSQTGGTYDSQKEAYNAFFDDLSDAVTTLETFIQDNPGATPFQNFDQFFGGDYQRWIQFANSLRLRLAIHIANVSPEKARQEAEAAVNAPYGLMLDGVAAVSGKGYTHPLAVLSSSWNDVLMGAPIESIMRGYNDPRLPAYFKPAVDEALISQGYEFKGIRQGIEIEDKGTYVEHSQLNISTESPAILMTSAEVYFLLAEGALRGWNVGGTAGDLYVKGVEASMAQWGVSAGDYLNQDNVAAPYVDPIHPENSVEEGNEYLNNVSPRWVEEASDEVKQQKISIQKWLAIFPEGVEGWTEVRRTGYPKIFPVIVNHSGGVIPSEHFVRRLNFPPSERDLNPSYSNIEVLLNGPDNGATPLWWDVDLE